MQNYILSLFSSFGIHIVIGVVLFFSFEITPPKKPELNSANEIELDPSKKQREIVKAVSVNKDELQKQIKRLEKKEADRKRKEEQRIKELERRAREAEKKIKKNQKNLKQLDKQKRQAEKEAKAAKERQIKESKRAKELKKAAEAQAAEKAKAEAEAKVAKQKAEDAKKQAEEEAAERKRKAQEALEKAELERQLAEQLAAEQAARKKAKRKQVLTEVEKYNALIRNTIQQNLRIDETFKDKSCRLNIKLASSGFVIGVRKLGGDERLCNEAERAVIKAETLPVSKDPDVFAQLKDINLTVEPEF